MTVKHVSAMGDRCDSKFEVILIDNLIDRDISYHHCKKVVDSLEYSRPVRGGFCKDCDSNNVRKGALYTPDLSLVNGQAWYLEAKGGSWTVDSRSRITHFLQANPDVDLRFIFRRDAPIKRGSKTKCSAWCKKHDCLVHIGMEVPEAWL